MALYLLPDYQTSLKSIGLSVQEKFNIDFQNSNHLGSPIRMILATFDLQVTSIPQVKFQVNWAFGSGWKTYEQIFKMAEKATILDFCEQ